ncbi:hypothetical protein ACIFOT_16750 [Neobacillus sp. NRS-1170]|uniref:hypothetical protein n=1 Tax=Neobacillus sp. NRS-1170 TaxID=3233898 RepID=UPI003D2E8F5A
MAYYFFLLWVPPYPYRSRSNGGVRQARCLNVGVSSCFNRIKSIWVMTVLAQRYPGLTITQ